MPGLPRGAGRAGLALTLLHALLAMAPCGAQSTADSTARVRGVVIGETGDTVVRAVIDAPGTTRTAVSDDHGRFELRDLSSGTVRIRARALGYRPGEVTVALTDGELAVVTIRLQAAPITLATVRTRARARERERFDLEPGSSGVTLDAATIQAVPAVGEADLLRTTQLLPGVVARNDFNTGLNVRGGESDQNLILLDGIQIYNPFHLGGLFGMFQDDMVGDVTLLPGSFPTPYGGRLSSVLDVTSAEETRTGVHGTTDVSALAVSGTVGSALADGRDSWRVGVRRTYADQVARAVIGDGLPYHFWDAELHATHLLKSGGTLSLTAYAGTDALNGNLAGLGDSVDVGSGGYGLNLSSGNYDFNWQNRLLGITWQQPLSKDAAIPLGIGQSLALGDSAWLMTRLSYSSYSTTLGIGENSYRYANSVRDVQLSGSLTWYRGVHGLTAGYELGQYHTRYTSGSPQASLQTVALDQSPQVGALFFDDRWQASSRLLLRPGVRIEHVYGRGFLLSPRGSAKFFLTPDLAITAGGGQYTQWMHGLRDEDTPLHVFDFWIGSDENIDVTTAQHGSLGVERWMGTNRFLRVEGWIKRYDKLYEPNPTDDPAVAGDEFVAATGRSHGVDVFIRQLDRGRLSGWIAYTYELSDRTLDGERYTPAQDQRHSLNVVGSYRTASGFVFGAHFGFGSGTPYTPVLGQLVRRDYDNGSNQWVPGVPRDIVPVEGQRNSARYPATHRLDLSVSRAYHWRSAKVTPSLQVINVYNRRNVFTYNYDYAASPPTREAISQFPILPSLGVRVEW
jgi:hypothetical protein